MIKTNDPRGMADRLLIFRILWGALLASQLMLAFLVFQVLQAPELPPDYSTATQAQIFLIAGLLFLVGSYVLPKLIMSQIKMEPSQVNVSKLFAPFIMGLALNEACSIMGFLERQIAANTLYAQILFGAAIASMLYRYPTEDRIFMQLEKLKRANTR